MTGPPTIARLSGGGRIWALGALLGDDDALEALARAVLSRWRPGDRLVVLGNMLGPNGDPAGTLDGLLRLRRRLMAANRGCGILFLRGAQEEMWQKALSLPFAMTPLEVLDWMLARGLGSIVEAYGASVADGRIACRNGPSEIARWNEGPAPAPGGACRPCRAAGLAGQRRRSTAVGRRRGCHAAPRRAGRRLLVECAKRRHPRRRADRGADAGWTAATRLVRGAGPSADAAAGDGQVLTVTRGRPAVVALDAAGAVLERIEP
jgi:hypothetical protein